MKKSGFKMIKQTAVKFMLITLAAALFSCADYTPEALDCYPSEDGGTYIILKNISIERTINPSSDMLSRFYLRGKPAASSGDYSCLHDDKTFASADELKQQKFSITPGIWDLMLTADSVFDGNSYITYKGTLTKAFTAGNTYVLSFNLSPTTTGEYGGMKITLQFSNGADKVTAVLKNKSTDTNTIDSTDFTGNSITSSDGKKSVTYSKKLLSPGNYHLTFYLYADGIDSPLNIIENVVRIQKDFYTTKTLEIDANETYDIIYKYYINGQELTDTPESAGITTSSGTGTVQPGKYTPKYGTTVGLPELQKTGFSFEGWYNSNTFTQPAGYLIERGETGTKTFYACFTNTLYVAPEQSGGDGSGTGATGGDGTGTTGTYPDESKNGYTQETAFSSIAAAVTKINDSTSPIDWNIAVCGTLNGAQKIENTAKNITLYGADGIDEATEEPKAVLNGGFTDESTGTTLSVKNCTGNITIKNLKITGGNQAQNSSGFGGGIYIETSNVTLDEGTLITGNKAKYGGGIYIKGGENGTNNTSVLNINNSAKITQNSALIYGGNIHATNLATVNMNGGEISEGSIETSSGGSTTGGSPIGGAGIGLQYGSKLNLTDGEIKNNRISDSSTRDKQGAGVWLDNTNSTLNSSQVQNTLNMSGGTISNNWIASQDEDKVMGGAVYVSQSSEMYMSGAAYIPFGADVQGNGEILENRGFNDVYLSLSSKINVLADLTTDETVASITPASDLLTQNPIQVVDPAKYYNKFALTGTSAAEWILNELGQLIPKP